MGVRGRGDGEVGAGAAAQGGSCGSARWKTQLLQHPPVPAQPGMLSTPGGEWSTATSREIRRALKLALPGQSGSPKSVPLQLRPGAGLGGARPAFQRWGRTLPGLGEESLSAPWMSGMEKLGNWRLPRSGDLEPLLGSSACAAATFGENELGREWGRGSLPEARRVLEPPSPAHSHRLGASRCPRLLGPRGQPRLCSASLYPPGMAPAGPTSVIPAGGTSPAPSLSGGMVAASSNPRSCGGGCGVCDLVGAAPCPGCRGGHGEGSR